ncbi:uncharacterized protein EV422DRAFT_152365 [Fimicolochytrium jonesii]|uniref:uncharacterized protein n=1 Tax=Fimicolochytrium jonesii TaxID=1396493 RepID=UPI0022FDEDC5|nr:uncharacterized protein EV422DRAFT_152365 [Fimicolochytrium jonesii]KAI8826087.1 hypothetical protein EV422DRAFT_152365 [Fimicolochytrium jonesii]
MCLKVFWQGLLSDQVNSNTVAAYLDTMHTTQGSASSAYKKLIERFPSSKQILRLYAKYLLTVENNAELSAQLLSQAEDIEFREQRDVRQRLEGPNGILPAANSAGYPSPPAVNYPEIAGSMMSDKGTTGRFHPSLSKVIGSTAHESVGFAGAASGRSMEISDDEESGRGYQNARVTHFPEEEIEPPTAKIAKVSIKPEVSSAGLSLASYNDEAGGGPEAEAVPRHKVGGARSTTSSATSNKDIRKMRAEKMRMMENLSTQIRRYILYERLWLLVLLGLIIANYDRSLQMFQAPDTFLSTLRVRTGRMLQICS